MKTAVRICKYFMLLLGAFFIFMSFDSFDGTDSIGNMILEFLINSIPGIVIIALIILLWKQELILGIIILIGAVILFFLFKLYDYSDDEYRWLTTLIVEVPMLTTGIMLLLHKKSNK